MRAEFTGIHLPRAGLRYRDTVRADDAQAVGEIVSSTGFFNPAELEVAIELVRERLGKGAASGYRFCFAELGASLAGYACFGPIAGTEASYDLYWIAVSPSFQNRGVGGGLLARVETAIESDGGRRVYVETSSRPQYARTRAFYARSGYRQEAVLRDFYAPADDKVIFVKQLGADP